MSGGRVFLHHDQDSLDRAYDQRVWARDMDGVMARLAARGEAARARLRPETHRYGPGADEVLDVFPAGPGAPVHVHVHGGAWRALGRGDASFLAPGFVEAGVTLVVPDFTNLPAARMPGMVAQVAAAVAWAADRVAGSGDGPGRLTLSGHSSGAHLAAAVATGGGGAPWALGAGTIRALLLVSGSYDLEPVMLSARRSYIELESDEVQRLSPVRHLSALRCPVTVAVGDRESPEFRRQAQVMRDGLAAVGCLEGWIEERDCDHFEMWERMSDPATGLGGAAIRLALGRTAGHGRPGERETSA